MIEPPKMPPIVSDVANAVSDFAQNTSQKVGDTLGKAGENVSNAAQKGVQAGSELAQNTAANFAKGVRTVDDTAGKVRDAIGQQVARFIEDGGLDRLNPGKILDLIDFGRFPDFTRSPINPGGSPGVDGNPGNGGGSPGVGGGNPAAPGNNQWSGFYNEINSLGGDIQSMQDQLTSGVDAEGNPLTPDQKLALQFELQQAMQERLQLITLLSNLIKMEHDAQMAIINNIRG